MDSRLRGNDGHYRCSRDALKKRWDALKKRWDALKKRWDALKKR